MRRSGFYRRVLGLNKPLVTFFVAVGLILILAPPSIRIEWMSTARGAGPPDIAAVIGSTRHDVNIELPIKVGRLPGISSQETAALSPASYKPAPIRITPHRGSRSAWQGARMMIPLPDRVKYCVRRKALALWSQNHTRVRGLACIGPLGFEPVFDCRAVCVNGSRLGMATFDLTPLILIR